MPISGDQKAPVCGELDDVARRHEDSGCQMSGLGIVGNGQRQAERRPVGSDRRLAGANIVVWSAGGGTVEQLLIRRRHFDIQTGSGSAIVPVTVPSTAPPGPATTPPSTSSPVAANAGSGGFFLACEIDGSLGGFIAAGTDGPVPTVERDRRAEVLTAQPVAGDEPRDFAPGVGTAGMPLEQVGGTLISLGADFDP